MVVRYVLAVLSILLLGCAVWQGGYGVLQLTGVCESLNNMYPVTGSFYNPGPYGCYLALTVPLAAWILFGNLSKGSAVNGIVLKVLTMVAALTLFIDAVVLPVTMSRTAWVASAVGVCVTFHREILSFCRKRKMVFLIAASAIVIAGLWGYKLKQASADGRFLLWKVASMAVSDNPFDGVGWDKVQGSYGMAQERYFSSGNFTETEKMVADAPAYVFNEYLQVGIAYGWGWTIVMCLIIAGGIVFAMKGKAAGMAGGIIAGAVTMMASYPFQFTLSIITIGVIIIAGYIASWRNAVSISGLLMTVAGTVFLSEDCQPKSLTTPFDLAHAYHKTSEWRMSNRMMMSILPYTSDPMPLVIIGKNYRELGMVDSAAYYFNRALHRCPNRMYPHYQLMLLYSDSATLDMAKAKREAEIILTMREKVISPAVQEMREKASEISQIKCASAR